MGDGKLRAAVSLFESIGEHLGVELSREEGIQSACTKSTNLSQELYHALKEASEKVKKGFVLVVLGDASLYAAVKAEAELNVRSLGVMTQCVQERKLQTLKRQGSLWKNICLKVNAKLGGCNNTLQSVESEPFFKDAIFIGIDVNHPAPGDNHKPSIAACVASMDKHAFRYRARVAVQMDDDTPVARKEVVTHLEDMVFHLLNSYKSGHGQQNLPGRIIVYRDGVSEGQFKEVKAKEVAALKSACMRMDPEYKPSVTFIVVQKRHHTRFQPLHEDQQVDLNVPPGTTVHERVTHPEHTNFFLCSHQGLLGTSKPSHYYVLYNDSDDEPLKLQKLTYDLCHLVARCTRSVSTPAPVYYAHLAAFRAKNHIEGSRLDRNASTKQYKDAVRVHKNIANEMYFV